MRKGVADIEVTFEIGIGFNATRLKDTMVSDIYPSTLRYLPVAGMIILVRASWRSVTKAAADSTQFSTVHTVQ